MSLGFARYLYVPDDGTRYSLSIVGSIEDALREEGLATGPDGDGLDWRPFRPAGELARLSDELGLSHPTLKVDWFDPPEAYTDPYLPPRGPWSVCPTCSKIIPTHGTVIVHPLSGEDVLVEIEECISCGAPFEPSDWERASDRTLFESSLVVTLSADSFQQARPTFGEGCPRFVEMVRKVVEHEVREMFVAF